MDQAAVRQVIDRPELAPLWSAVRGVQGELAALAKTICEIPAPTFEEEIRAQWVADLMQRICGQKPERDAAGNVWVRIQGTRKGAQKSVLLLSAHLDTVFPKDTDCRVRESEGKLFGPGIGDNCAGLSVLLTGLKMVCEQGRAFCGEWIFAANTGEEGLGDLKGMRALCQRFKSELSGTLALDGNLGSIVGAAVGSRRYKVRVTGKGGHSWADFGVPSAVHQIAKIAAELSTLEVSAEPRSSFNIGVIQGGTSINTIAAEAELLLDLRSVEEFALERLDAQAHAAIRRAGTPDGLDVEILQLGERPVGDAKLTQKWVECARGIFALHGKTPSISVSSTDANVPLSMGIPASTLGIVIGGDAHTLNEWIDPASLPEGLELFLQTVWLASEHL